MRINGIRTKPAGAALMLVALLAGCASGGPTELLAPRPEPVQPASPQPSTQLPETVTIDAIDIVQSDDAARIEIETSEALVWTTYRDESGQLVVELPNSRPGAAVGDLESSTGLVDVVRVTSEAAGSREVTRLLIGTRGEAEHSVSASAGGLRIELGSMGQLAALEEPAADAPEMMEEADLVEPSVGTAWPDTEGVGSETTTVASAQETGETTVWESEPSPQAPVEAAVAEEMDDEMAVESWVEADASPTVTVNGPSATELLDIDVVRIEDSVVVRLLGDGKFSYETLSLEAPYRYVVDLTGVANFAPQSVYSFSNEPVERVRVAQFKTQPDPVSRVVVDLAYPATPELVGLPDGLALSFSGAAASWSETSTLVDDVSAAEGMDTAEFDDSEISGVEVAEPVVEAPSEPDPEPAVEQVYEAAPATYEAAPAPYEAVDAEPDQIAALEDDYAAVEFGQEAAPVVEEYSPEVEAPPAWEAPEPQAEPEMTAEAPAPVNVQFAEPPPAGDDSGNLFDSQSIASAGDRVYRGEPITMHLKDADIRDLLRSFSEFSGLNFVLQPSVRGTVTVELTDVPWDQALDLVLKTNDLGYELEGNILRIAPLAKLREEAEAEQRLRQAQAQAVPLATMIKRVSYADAQQVARVLQTGSNSVMSRRGTVVVDARTNTLIIKELPNFIDTVIAVIETLDIPEPQVMIEARIIETTKRFSRTLGINWGFAGVSSAATGNTTGLVFPNNGTVAGGVDLTQPGTAQLGITLGNVLDTFQLDIALQAAESEGLINILSAPRITTLNNKSAQIQSGLQIPIQTVANNTVSVQFVNATLKLQVTPHVTAEGTVLMDINIQKREPLLAFAVAGAANAPISTKDASTNVIVRDGGTTVIGGIYEVTSDEGQDKVPGLSKVPLLKHLFKNNRQSEENEELLIFITPRVVNL
jgi:type IV pilus assembly protein PilQ